MNQTEVGYVTRSRNFLVALDGMPTVKINDIVESEEGVRGLVHALYRDSVEVLLLDDANITPGQLFKKADKHLNLAVGDQFLGRAINPLGIPIDGKGTLNKSVTTKELPVEQEATGIYSRQYIKDQFVTGITLIDTLIPIGRGQRELILGDPHSGKTSFLIDLIANQKNTGVICIYASIGKPIAQVRLFIDILTSIEALKHTIVIAASSSEPAPLIYLAPHAAMTIAEYFQRQGKDVLLILDDLGNHAKIYREISLLAGKPPGRESYPGDIFFEHSHMIERAGNFNKDFGGGSITAIPVVEINLSDFTSFIPTNLMSMTDGHLMFKASLHNQGQNPAIDISLSVSRVGRQTQNKIQNLLSQKIRQVLAQAEDLASISRFAAELPYETRLILRQKQLIFEMIRQDALTSLSLDLQIVLLGLVFTKFLQEKDQAFVRRNKQKLIQSLTTDSRLAAITNNITQIQTIDDLVNILNTMEGVLNQLCK